MRDERLITVLLGLLGGFTGLLEENLLGTGRLRRAGWPQPFMATVGQELARFDIVLEGCFQDRNQPGLGRRVDDGHEQFDPAVMTSALDWFAERGFNTWCMDNEGYGRSDKNRPINFDIPNGADDLAAGSDYILNKTGERGLYVYGISSGALKAALFAQRYPQRIARPVDWRCWERK